MTRILLAYKDTVSREKIRQGLEQDNCLVQVVNSGREALLLLEKNHYDVVIVKEKMCQVNGSAICQQAKLMRPQTFVIILTEDRDVDTLEQMINDGADACLSAAVDEREIFARVRAFVRRMASYNESKATFAKKFFQVAMRTQNILPPRSLSETPIVPPWSSTIALEMASPSPEPDFSLAAGN